MLDQGSEGVYTAAFTKSREILKQLSPLQIVQSTLCDYNSSKSCFYISSFGHTFEISYPQGEVYYLNSNLKPAIAWKLILLNYLSSAKTIDTSGVWVTYRELPYGNVFYPSIQTYVLSPLGRFIENNDKSVIELKFSQLGFKQICSTADIAMTGYFAPKVPILLQYCEGEDNIPPSVQLLFDDSIAEHMHIEDIAALCSIIKDLLTDIFHATLLS